MIFRYNDKHIYYETAGQGPALLLLHGFLENASMWDSLEKLVHDKFTVIRIDLPGHGRSDVYSEIHSMEFMADVVRELLKSMGVNSISIIGHSMGGYVALAYLEKHPETVRQCILLNSTTYADSADRKINRERALKLIPDNKELFINVSINNLFAEDTREDFSKDIQQLQMEANEIPTSGILAAIRGMKDRKDRSDVLKEFQGSKILICGTKDTVVPFKDSKRAASFTKSKLISMASGHMTLIENSKELTEIVHFIE
ncbi:MAG: alpha/beta hydrolase [Bacteroidia bacterium]|nr:alpha/beta hydrolase [Bacteroidia bacterium]MBT8275714.1 alpha/beta hydrolase [Bacteroidia bacterium]NNF30924.1 alpha/beta hydrolase [Flavobacteriaceae bacterium]NNJ82330.1 alpha/beta hydrolase [Flavobacteriaceae bacterium]